MEKRFASLTLIVGCFYHNATLFLTGTLPWALKKYTSNLYNCVFLFVFCRLTRFVMRCSAFSPMWQQAWRPDSTC